MLRYKQFLGSGQGLEAEINAWLREFEPDVEQMVQTYNSNGEIAISFLFAESFRGQEIRLSSERRVIASPAPAPEELFPDEPLHLQQDPVG